MSAHTYIAAYRAPTGGRFTERIRAANIDEARAIAKRRCPLVLLLNVVRVQDRR